MDKIKAELKEAVERLYESQKRDWPEFGRAVASLSEVRYRQVQVERRQVRLQFNPGRIANTLAPENPDEVAARPCFLCTANRPAAQDSISFHRRWLVVCNPLPILEYHMVVIDREHTPQTVHGGTLSAMLRFTLQSGFTTLYNGPKSGASAPDHLHFQAFPPGCLPLERRIPRQATSGSDGIFCDPRLPRRIYLSAKDPRHLEDDFADLLAMWNQAAGRPAADEPEMNLAVLARETSAACPLVVVHPRGRHRPSAYYARGADRLVISPGAADMAGLVIVPRREDFARLSGRLMRKIYREVCQPGEVFAGLAAELENRKK